MDNNELIEEYSDLLASIYHKKLFVNEYCLKVERDALFSRYDREEYDIISTCIDCGIVEEVMEKTREKIDTTEVSL